MLLGSGMRWPLRPALVLALLMAAVTGGALRLSAGAADAPVLVCPTCAQTSLAEAVAAAPAGATIEVRGGVYPGGLVIDKPLVLRGVDHPVIDGGGRGTVVRVVGADVTIQGLTIRGTGTNHDQEDAAIVFDGGRATVIDNRIEDALFGIYLKRAHGSVIKNNIVLAKRVEIAMRGDSIKIWYCDDVVIEGNQASDGRDIILWYSNRALVRNNAFNRSRYGLHLMFSDSARIEGNSLRANSIGLYIMYGRDPVIIGNNLSDNRGPSGGGLGFKDVDRAVVEGNRFVHNNIGAQVDTSPRERGIENYWRDNVFAFNEIGIGFMPSVSHNTLTGNAFLDNTEHVAIIGRGQLKDMTWAVDGRGNYWSDYAGYDANGDGVGDRPYRSQRLFERLTDQHPELRLFLFSPAAMAVDFAAKAFPEVRPEVKFEDPAPLMAAPVSPYLPPVDAASEGSRVTLGIVSTLALIGVVFFILRLRPATVTARRRLATMRARGV
jgi:nitrous oxidase accessory protein